MLYFPTIIPVLEVLGDFYTCIIIPVYPLFRDYLCILGDKCALVLE
jgi:hypothetical protein